MPYYNTCPNCESSLDPGEKCVCQKPRETFAETLRRIMEENPEFSLASLEAAQKKKTLPPAATDE